MQREIGFDQLNRADLVIDCVYKGGVTGNVGDDPLNKLLRCGNQGGFRYTGSYDQFSYPYIVLYSSFDDFDWPDNIDFQSGIFTYYGDNKKPGHEILDTPKKGNRILIKSFNDLHVRNYQFIKPFFVFGKGFSGRDVIFRGVAVPGGLGLTSFDDLQAIWKFNNNQRFQNYKALFTILNVPVIKREWIDDLNENRIITSNTPKEFTKFYERGIYTPLISQRSAPIRRKQDQLPTTTEEKNMLAFIFNYFDGRAHDFELFAADIAKMLLHDVMEIDVTRPWRDGGRDAIGKMRVGTRDSFILIDFALEAKCYNTNNSVGVRAVSRLISRIKSREFGILVTTSYIDQQAYKEVTDDKHPILFVCGKDIIDILKENGLNNINILRPWMDKLFEQKDNYLIRS